jgi:DNA polymerase-3 subunit epsilon
MAKGGIRKALTLGLGAVGVGAVVLAGAAAWSVVHMGGGSVDFIGVIVGAFLVLGALWALFAILDSHFDDLERLRANILVAAVADDARLPTPHADFPPSLEVTRLRAAVATLIDKRIGPGVRPSAKLVAVLSTLDEGIVVMTDAGQISLVNQAARERLGGSRVDIGTSIFASLERHVLHGAMERAREQGRPVITTLLSVDGDSIIATVADLPGHTGAVLRLAPIGTGADGGRVDHDMRLHDIPHAPTATLETPLAALAGLVFDSETTGLDVMEDRIVSVGAVLVNGGHVAPGLNLDRLVNPSVPIPPRSTAIHGITDEMVADAPPFAQVWQELQSVFAERVVIGHNIGFDLAVLKREAERADLSWQTPKFLDTLRLVVGLFPDWQDLNLETIAGHLGVDVQGRHTALGDALVTAEIWARLQPILEEAKVVTLGDALAFQNNALHMMARQKKLGWVME